MTNLDAPGTARLPRAGRLCGGGSGIGARGAWTRASRRAGGCRGERCADARGERLEFYDQLLEVAPDLANRVVFLTGAARDPRVHGPIEQRGVPLISKMDDLRLVVDAVRLALLRRTAPVVQG